MHFMKNNFVKEKKITGEKENQQYKWKYVTANFKLSCKTFEISLLFFNFLALKITML